MEAFVESARGVARALTQSDIKPNDKFHCLRQNEDETRLWPCDTKWKQDSSNERMTALGVIKHDETVQKSCDNSSTNCVENCRTLVSCQADHQIPSEDSLEEEEVIFLRPTRSVQTDVPSPETNGVKSETSLEDLSADDDDDDDSARSYESEKILALNQPAIFNEIEHAMESNENAIDKHLPTAPTTTASTESNQMVPPQAYACFFATDIVNDNSSKKHAAASANELFVKKRADDVTGLRKGSLASEPVFKVRCSFSPNDEKQMQFASQVKDILKKDDCIGTICDNLTIMHNTATSHNQEWINTTSLTNLTDEEIARQLFEEEMAENFRRQKQLEEDERLAAQFAAEYQNAEGEEHHPTPQPSPEYYPDLYTNLAANIDVDSRSKELQEHHTRAQAQTILETERSYQELQRQQQEEADAELARLLMQSENGPQSYQQPLDLADADYALQLQKETEMEEASMRLIRQLQESEEGSVFPMQSSEDELLAWDLQRQYENSASTDLSYLINQPYGEEIAALKDLHPDSTVDECLAALAKSGYQVDEAHRLLSEFPSLGKPVATKRSFGQVSEEFVERSPVYSIQVLVEDLKRKFGHRIPIVALRQAAEDANGILDEAENILYQKFPQEMIYMSMHAKSTVANQTSASQNEKVQAASVRPVRVTKVRGVDMESLTRERTSSPSQSDESLDDIDPHYLDLARRDYYTAEDLIYGCQKYGDYYHTQPSNGSSRNNSETRNTVIYESLRKRKDQWASHLQQTKLLQGAANKAGRYAEAHEWKQKFEQILEKSIAVNNETADCLFAMKNPRFVSRLFEIRQQYQQDTGGASSASTVTNEVSVDLHMLHVQEAEDRVRAVLEIAAAKHWRRVKIITGKGLHSRTYGESSVRGAIERLLQTHAQVQSLEDQPGYFIARLKLATTLG